MKKSIHHTINVSFRRKRVSWPSHPTSLSSPSYKLSCKAWQCNCSPLDCFGLQLPSAWSSIAQYWRMMGFVIWKYQEGHSCSAVLWRSWPVMNMVGMEQDHGENIILERILSWNSPSPLASLHIFHQHPFQNGADLLIYSNNNENNNRSLFMKNKSGRRYRCVTRNNWSWRMLWARWCCIFG